MLYWDTFQILCLPHVNKCDLFSLSNSTTVEMLQHLDSKWIQCQFSVTFIFSKHGPVYFLILQSLLLNWKLFSQYFPTMKIVQCNVHDVLSPSFLLDLLHSLLCAAATYPEMCSSSQMKSNSSICLRFNMTIWLVLFIFHTWITAAVCNLSPSDSQFPQCCHILRDYLISPLVLSITEMLFKHEHTLIIVLLAFSIQILTGNYQVLTCLGGLGGTFSAK